MGLRPSQRKPQGNFLLRVNREKAAYRFTVRDLRTGKKQDLEGWGQLEHYVKTLLRQGLR